MRSAPTEQREQWLYVLERKLPERIQNQTMMTLMTMKQSQMLLNRKPVIV